MTAENTTPSNEERINTMINNNNNQEQIQQNTQSNLGQYNNSRRKPATAHGRIGTNNSITDANNGNIIINNTFNFKINKSINIYDNQKHNSNYNSVVQTTRDQNSNRCYSSGPRKGINYSVRDNKNKKENNSGLSLNYLNFLESKKGKNRQNDISDKLDYYSDRKSKINAFSNFERQKNRAHINTDIGTPKKISNNHRGISHFNNRKIALDDFLLLNESPKNKGTNFGSKINYTVGNSYNPGKSIKIYGNNFNRIGTGRKTLNFFH